MDKKVQVVILCTNNESSLYNGSGKLELIYPQEDNNFNNKHLYIISDDEIKVGDWYINTFATCSISPQKHDNIKELKNHKKDYRFKYCKKVIAATDTKLTTDNRTYIFAQSERTHLPQLSQKFIEEYIESYNNGKVITDVLAEYHCLTSVSMSIIDFSGKETPKDLTEPECIENKLKINQDNTITVKTI